MYPVRRNAIRLILRIFKEILMWYKSEIQGNSVSVESIPSKINQTERAAEILPGFSRVHIPLVVSTPVGRSIHVQSITIHFESYPASKAKNFRLSTGRQLSEQSWNDKSLRLVSKVPEVLGPMSPGLSVSFDINAESSCEPIVILGITVTGVDENLIPGFPRHPMYFA
ncbi:hypothetical protein BDV35DRAFT_104417 [Aspergillus flavus]|uniref:Uncharacterized protein n=1 Tax=Aspergillus flavus TaxID=5059 RepID=A0A5N6GH97_ASPFL|nr:hypothetical protein BDV35DRAFT_104417 [Aspergillus flavus]GMG13456.1 unnamed protein product [Aspergillus oryzae]